MLTAQTRVLGGDACTIGTVATCARRDLTIGNATSVNFFTQRGEFLVFGKTGFGFHATQVSTDVAHVILAQSRSKTHHDGVGTLARFELGELLGDVFGVLLCQFGVGGDGGVAIGTVAADAHTIEDGRTLGGVWLGGGIGGFVAFGKCAQSESTKGGRKKNSDEKGHGFDSIKRIVDSTMPPQRPSACTQGIPMVQPQSPVQPPPTDQVKHAMGWLHTARFLTTAAQLHHLPAYDQPEIAFVGRSNAGKSTCINVLTQQRQLAYASKTPGRTQHINLFALGRQNQTDAVLADLPGYGYAAVPKTDKVRWQQVMAQYLMTRDNLVGVVLLCDPRLGLTELDEILLEVIRPKVEQGLQFLMLLTKADKLNRTEATKALSIARLQSGGGQAHLFSALKKQGVEEVSLALWQWTHPTETPT